MKTEDLIDLLVTDTKVKQSLHRATTLALLIGALLSAAVLIATLGIRPDLGDAIQTGRVVFKVGVTLLFATTASLLVVNIGKPGVSLRPLISSFLVPFTMLVTGIVAELVSLPSSSWEVVMIGRYASYCLTFIPLLSVAPFALLFLALKGGAPRHPGFAGAAAGLAASSIGAAIYAWHCPDDSPLFVACWYVLSIAFVTLCGYLAGRRWLIW